MSTLVEANSNFALDLLKALVNENPDKNIISSPLSITAAIAMVLLGAKKTTADQINKFLHFDKVTEPGNSTEPGSSIEPGNSTEPGSSTEPPVLNLDGTTESGSTADQPLPETECDAPGGIHHQLKELLSAINNHTPGYELSTANRLYGSNTYEFLQQYLHCLKELYNAELVRVDFSNAPEEVRQQINSWVESQTNGKIQDMFPSNSIEPNTALVLVNAIFFKGKWMVQFDPKETQEGVFRTSQDQSKNVEMMTQRGDFVVAEVENPPMRVLELPYDNRALSMFILLPDDNGSADEIVRELTSAQLQEVTRPENMNTRVNTIVLPKFKLEEEYLLRPTLEVLGMSDLFSPGTADLSGMTGDPNLSLSEVRHKAYIEVNEEGTEAAASTGVTGTLSAEANPSEFRADRPYILFLRHNGTQSILFTGKVYSP